MISYKKTTTGREIKLLASNDYNYIFYCDNGNFYRWGKTHEDDPQFSKYGPELADIEISTICHKGCKWCYKSNTATGKNMSLEDFNKILKSLPRSVCQIAFGIGDIDANPDMYKIFDATRHAIIVPNVTINGVGLDDYHADQLAHFCGSVAVSHYNDEECFEAVYKLTRRGMKQVNIHKLLSKETLASCFDLIDKVAIAKKNWPKISLKAADAPLSVVLWESRKLADVNAVIFLSIKREGRGKDMNPLDEIEYKVFMEYALASGVFIGFDSCAGPKMLELTGDKFKECIEPCESTLFSVYIDVNSMAYPCSFTAHQWEGVPVPANDPMAFMKRVWYSDTFKSFRRDLLKNGRKCPCYQV